MRTVLLAESLYDKPNFSVRVLTCRTYLRFHPHLKLIPHLMPSLSLAVLRTVDNR